jgi:hypothetical protein
MKNCFYGRNTSNMLNIYVPVGSTTLTTCLQSDANSMFGEAVTWTNDVTNKCYYNTQYNVYIYNGIPTIEDILIDFNYTSHDNGMVTLTGWKQTLNGVSSYDMVIPNDPRIIL